MTFKNTNLKAKIIKHTGTWIKVTVQREIWIYQLGDQGATDCLSLSTLFLIFRIIIEGQMNQHFYLIWFQIRETLNKHTDTQIQHLLWTSCTNVHFQRYWSDCYFYWLLCFYLGLNVCICINGSDDCVYIYLFVYIMFK